MTNATMNREFNPRRSPLLGFVAVVAAALTLGATVLLPASRSPFPAPVVATAADAPTQIVKLPAIEVVGARTTKTAAKDRWTLPAVFKKG